MLDIKWIRENPEALDAALARRSAPPIAAEIVALVAHTVVGHDWLSSAH